VTGQRKYVVKLKDVEEFGGVRLASRISLAERAVEEQKERKMKIERERKRKREREEGPEVRCFLGKQKSHIEMSLKSPRNPWPLSSPLSPRRQAVLNFSGMLEASKARSRNDIYVVSRKCR